MTTASQTPASLAALQALVELAQREHQAGRLPEAAAAIRQILAIRPDVAEAHNDLGMILAQQGRLSQAQPCFEQAIALKPDFVEAHYNLGNVLSDLGTFNQAAVRYEHAISLRPDYADAHNNLGNILWKQGKLDEAAARYQQALALRPDYAEAHNNLGNVLMGQDKLNEAAAQFEQAIASRPGYAEAHNHLGSAFWRQGKLDAAAACCEQALALRPDDAEAHNNLGIILGKQNKNDQAVSRFEQSLALRPDYSEAHNNLGNALWKQGKFDEAAAHYQRALALQPNYAEAHNNLGNVLWKQGKLDEAAAWYEKALTLRPDYGEAHNNLGNALLNQGQFDKAVAHYERAFALQPDFAEAQMGLAICCLSKGDYQRGWPLYEGRLRLPGAARQPSLPRWSGEPLAGRGLLLLAEQGLGDTLQFIRYARLLKERGARVVLAAQRALGRLLASQPDLDELFILGSAEELPRCDFYLPLLSLPGALGTDRSTIPCQVPYLAADPDLTDHWRRELAGIDGFKIGIVWQGARNYVWDRWRSIPLAHFAPLARLPGVRLISLQKGAGSEQIAMVDFPVLDLSGRLDEEAGPFMDTAAVLRNLDLVVTSDTAIPHLAGALGVPVWAAIQFVPEWRWLRDRDDSPWYPTMRIFRQTAFNEWSDVFERIAAAVQARRSEAT